MNIEININSIAEQLIEHPELFEQLVNCMCKNLCTEKRIDEYLEKVEK